MNPLERRLSGPKKQSGHCGVEKNLLSLPGIELRPSIPLSVVLRPEELRLQIKETIRRNGRKQLEMLPEKATTLLCTKGQMYGMHDKSVDQF
jgi:hypothetical protein